MNAGKNFAQQNAFGNLFLSPLASGKSAHSIEFNFMRPSIFDLQRSSMNKKGGFRATIYDKTVAVRK
jgi:hypothetical protein